MTIDPIPISLVAHTVFCPRRAWLEAVGERVDHPNIEHGVLSHERVDSRQDERSTGRRSVNVWHDGLGIVGKCDLVTSRSGGLEVAEFKSSLRSRSDVTPAQRVQLALQGLCLEEMGRKVAKYRVYYTDSRRSALVAIDDSDRERAANYVDQTRAIIESDEAPPPLAGDPRCGKCSHESICLPNERNFAVVRKRILPHDPQGEVLHLTTPGSRARLRNGRVEIVRGGDKLGEVPVERVDAIVVHGNVDVSSALIREMLWRARTVVWCSWTGRSVGYATSTMSPNGGSRVAQRSRSEQGDIRLAREFLGAKIANQ